MAAITQNLGSRNKPVSPALTDAVSRVIEQTYGPDYTVVMRSGAGHSITGTKRHTPGRAGQLGVAADFQIFAPDGHQLAGAELDPLLQNWVGIEGSMGANRYPGNKGSNFTHMDLIGGIQPYSVPLGRKEDVFWTYDGLDPKSTFNEQQQKQMVASGEIQPAAAPQIAPGAFASLQPPAGGTQTPTPPSALQGFQPTISAGDFGSPAQAAISDLISAPSTTSDVDKLAGVMLAEARGEGQEGMAGVGNVVLNRANATGNRFPKTIDGVINNEFAKPLGPNDVSPDEWVEARTLATQLQNGTIPDNTGGAVYFANTATAGPNAYAQIAASGPVSTTIGNHTYHVDTGIGPVARGTGAPPPIRGPGPGGALGVDLGTQPAGMPLPPSRPGAFDWLGGGAPDAGVVPTPGISPLRPAIGGPGDRRPQPPLPQMRPAALGIPDPRMRPSAPQSPVDAFSPSAGPLDLIPYSTQPRATAAPAIAPPLERANRIVSGQGGPVIPLTRDEMLSSRANAAANTERTLGLGGNFGTPETAMSLASTFPRPPMAAPSPWTDWTRAFDIPPPLSRMADAPPPVRPTITPDFDFAAGPGPTFTPPSLAPDIRGRPEYPGSLPAAPPPLATAADDPYRAPSSFDASRPYSGFTPPHTETVSAAPVPPSPSPIMPAGDPWAKAYGSQPPPLSIQPLPKVSGVTFLPPGGTSPTEATPVPDAQSTAAVPEPPSAAPPIPSYAQQDPVRDPAATAAVAATAAAEEQRRRGFFGRIFGGPGGGGGGFGGFGGFVGPNGFFSNAGSFTPTAGSGGSAPFNMQPNGQMGTTRYVHGSVTGNPNMQGTMWNRSGDNGSVGYVTDPFNPGTSLIYSGSPNRF